MPLLLQQELSRVALNASSECTTTVIDRSVLFYHYCIDGYNDKGWGCGYRTLQSIVSSLRLAALIDADKEPSLPDIQAILVAAGEYPASMQHSTTWIGANEAGRFLQHAYNLDYRIIDLRHGSLAWEVDVQSRIAQHLEDLGTPIMCGGTTDNMSRAVLGISLHEQDPKRSQVLIMDPHYVHGACNDMQDDTSKSFHQHLDYLNQQRWLSWQPVTSFLAGSAYNLLCPLTTTSTTDAAVGAIQAFDPSIFELVAQGHDA